jgi:hypothetical protein
LCFSKAAELYQPGEAPCCVGFFQNTPIVASQIQNKFLVNPNPVEVTNTFLAPFIAPLILHIQFDFIFCSHPSGWAVKQINPLILGSIIIFISFNR